MHSHDSLCRIAAKPKQANFCSELIPDYPLDFSGVAQGVIQLRIWARRPTQGEVKLSSPLFRLINHFGFVHPLLWLCKCLGGGVTAAVTELALYPLNHIKVYSHISAACYLFIIFSCLLPSGLCCSLVTLFWGWRIHHFPLCFPCLLPESCTTVILALAEQSWNPIFLSDSSVLLDTIYRQ